MEPEDVFMCTYVILNDDDREQDHSQSEDIQFDTVQNGTSDVGASAADLLLALFSKPCKQIKHKPVIDAKQVSSETGYLPMAACILYEARVIWAQIGFLCVRGRVLCI